jgi:hypothetical protein
VTLPRDAKFIANTAFPSLGVRTMDRVSARVTSASSCGGGSGSAGFGDCACRRGSHSPSARQFQARASKVSEDVIVVAA